MSTPLKLFLAIGVIAIVLFFVTQSGMMDDEPIRIISHDISRTQEKQAVKKIIPIVEAEATLSDKIENELITAGWDANAAYAVATLNDEWFTVMQSDHPEKFEKQIILLKNMGYDTHFMPLFEAHPETAALLMASHHPDRLAKVLQNEDCYPIMTGLFVQHAAPEDALDLAQALDKQGSLICRLLQRGLVGSQALFIYPRDKPGVQEYDRWLSTVLEEALEQSDDKLSSMINLLFEQKSNIRTRMIEDATFRYAFRNDLWPKFIRVTTKIKYPFELYLNDPYLWDFVALSEGESLLAQWHWFLSIEHIKNLTPAVLLFGDDAYPKPLHPFIIKAILDNDANTLLSLLYYGKEPLFIRLMQRDLSDDLRQKVLSILSEQGVNYPVTLLNWDKASNTDLYAELLQDATGTLRTMKKVVQGREISNTEVFFAVLDVVSLTVSAVSLGSGSIMTSGVKQTMKIGGNVLKTMKYGAKARTYLFNDTKTLKQYVQNKLQISVNDAVANNASNMLLASFAKKEIYSQMIRPKGAELLSFNITPTMKFLFEQVNVNRTTLKRINHQWSSQLLIQKNGAVLIEMDHNKLSTELCLFFNETSVKNKILQAWQKNASAWWLMNATQ